MAQTGIVVKNNSKIVYKAVFAGDVQTGVAQFKSHIESRNSSASFTYDEYDSKLPAYLDAVVDESANILLNW